MKIFLHIGLAILLLLCLLQMPYGYFQLVRVIAFVLFGYFAYMANKENNEGLMFLFIGLAILFQPFFKIPLGRTLWNVVDVLVAVILIMIVFTSKKVSTHEG